MTFMVGGNVFSVFRNKCKVRNRRKPPTGYIPRMRKHIYIAVFLLAGVSAWAAAAKPKVVTFGRWITVKWMVGASEDQEQPLKVRSLLVNGDIKEFTTGEPHDVTDRLFAVQRAVRLNDVLPADAASAPKWKWQPGGWLLVSRVNAHVSNLTLPEFDPYYSRVVWYRDLAAYCGVSDVGDKVYAIVVQIGRKKPLLRRLLGPAKSGAMPDSECDPPQWQKQPSRVTFAQTGGDKVIYEIHGHAVEIAPEEGADVEEK
jgi:hypothetical protein